MDQYSSHFVKGSLYFCGLYLLCKAVGRISETTRIEYRLSSSSSRLPFELCTMGMGMLGAGLIFSVLLSKD